MRERERERALLGIIHNGGSRAAPRTDSASPHYGQLDRVTAYGEDVPRTLIRGSPDHSGTVEPDRFYRQETLDLTAQREWAT